ncbi:hypothetical protein WA026_005987 [Henosepilachna vigintioctopunctata]|uniref:Uncharacterized protein n=1 Tax=Henosepilachna vigintioctopunctata TaxID=420089 RepID=A0AAW1U502_9CUCU
MHIRRAFMAHLRPPRPPYTKPGDLRLAPRWRKLASTSRQRRRSWRGEKRRGSARNRGAFPYLSFHFRERAEMTSNRKSPERIGSRASGYTRVLCAVVINNEYTSVVSRVFQKEHPRTCRRYMSVENKS